VTGQPAKCDAQNHGKLRQQEAERLSRVSITFTAGLEQQHRFEKQIELAKLGAVQAGQQTVCGQSENAFDVRKRTGKCVQWQNGL
jgi:hypothetical protein